MTAGHSKTKFNHVKFKEVEQKWIVLYGAKSISERKSATFYKDTEAEKFFKEKEGEGLYVDVFEERVTIETRKVTS